MQQGAPLDLLFGMISQPNQFRLTLLQMLLPLTVLHEHDLLHCDVKMENYVNAIRAYDPEWSDSCEHTLANTQTTFEFSHNCNGLDIKPMLIDFGLSRLRCESTLTTYVVTSLHSRPPELIFVIPSQPLLYTESSEAFSYALTVLTELCYLKCIRQPNPPVAFMSDAISCIGQQSTIAYEFDTPKSIAEHTWYLIGHIGYPGDEALTQSPLGRVVKAHKQSFLQLHSTLDCPVLCEQLSPDGVDMLRQLMTWDQHTRTTLREIVVHKYFEPLVKRTC
jgi:serine/threonine protein kinase